MSNKIDFKDFKLSTYQQMYLVSVVVPRYVRETGKPAAQIWFEVFIEELDRMGYTLTKKVKDEL